MDVQMLREKAERCRELMRIAARDEIRDQLRQWAEDFDEEADALERTLDTTGNPRSMPSQR